jgi:hypothetical protein
VVNIGSASTGQDQFATAAVSGKKIGNLKLPVVLKYRVKTTGAIQYRESTARIVMILLV